MGKISLDTQIERKTYAILDNVTTTRAQVGPNKFVTSSFERDANENIVKTIVKDVRGQTLNFEKSGFKSATLSGFDVF